MGARGLRSHLTCRNDVLADFGVGEERREKRDERSEKRESGRTMKPKQMRRKEILFFVVVYCDL